MEFELKNRLTAKFYWNLKSCVKTTLNGVEKYICLFDVIEMRSMKCFQYFTSLIPTRLEDGVWGKTKLIFIPMSENSPDLQEFFFLYLKV